MAFYYVKNGGTAAASDNGRTATKRTGSFATMGAANYYDSVADVKNATTLPADGDTIYVSHLHVWEAGASTNLIWQIAANVDVVSVADTACDQYLRGATEKANTPSNSTDAFFETNSKNCRVYGVT